jgi:hypothetical protein
MSDAGSEMFTMTRIALGALSLAVFGILAWLTGDTAVLALSVAPLVGLEYWLRVTSTGCALPSSLMQKAWK